MGWGSAGVPGGAGKSRDSARIVMSMPRTTAMCGLSRRRARIHSVHGTRVSEEITVGVPDSRAESAASWSEARCVRRPSLSSGNTTDHGESANPTVSSLNTAEYTWPMPPLAPGRPIRSSGFSVKEPGATDSTRTLRVAPVSGARSSPSRVARSLATAAWPPELPMITTLDGAAVWLARRPSRARTATRASSSKESTRSTSCAWRNASTWASSPATLAVWDSAIRAERSVRPDLSMTTRTP